VPNNAPDDRLLRTRSIAPEVAYFAELDKSQTDRGNSVNRKWDPPSKKGATLLRSPPPRVSSDPRRDSRDLQADAQDFLFFIDLEGESSRQALERFQFSR